MAKRYIYLVFRHADYEGDELLAVFAEADKALEYGAENLRFTGWVETIPGAHWETIRDGDVVPDGHVARWEVQDG